MFNSVRGHGRTYMDGAAWGDAAIAPAARPYSLGNDGVAPRRLTFCARGTEPPPRIERHAAGSPRSLCRARVAGDNAPSCQLAKLHSKELASRLGEIREQTVERQRCGSYLYSFCQPWRARLRLRARLAELLARAPPALACSVAANREPLPPAVIALPWSPRHKTNAAPNARTTAAPPRLTRLRCRDGCCGSRVRAACVR